MMLEAQLGGIYHSHCRCFGANNFLQLQTATRFKLLGILEKNVSYTVKAAIVSQCVPVILATMPL